GTPTGIVTFSEGATSLGQGTLTTTGGISTASFTTSGLAVGSHTLTASYAGDSNFIGSTKALTQTVSKASTNLAVVSSITAPVAGQTFTFTATVTVVSPGNGTPTGTVQFQIDNSDAGGPVSVSTSGGLTTASFSTPPLAAG